MNKKVRQMVFEMFGGHCAYCGCELQKGWHIDHCSPVHRITKSVGGHFITKDTGQVATEADFETGNFVQVPRKIVPGGMLKGENHNTENMLPACPSCNLYKHSTDLEGFRAMLGRTVAGLNNNSVQFKFAKRFGLVEETNKPVIFYFETLAHV